MGTERERSCGIGAYLRLMLIFVLWGSLYVVSKGVMRDLPPFLVSFLRFLIAYVFLRVLTIGRQPEEADETGRRMHRRYILVLGLGGYTIAVNMQLLGTQLAGASIASLINAVNPVTITLMAAVLLKEKLTPGKLIGIIMAVAGVYLMIGTGGDINMAGAALSICAVLGWSFVSVITRKGLSDTDPILTTRSAVGIAAVGSLAACIAEQVLRPQELQLHTGTVLGLLYMGILCTGLTYILWNRSLAELPASRCSSFYPLQPLTSTILGIVVFHEKITVWFVAGAWLITAGILLSLLSKERRGKA